MQEKEIQVFMDGVVRYFTQTFGETALVDPPFILGKASVLQDYSGVIGISGEQKGAVYFTAPEAMVVEMLTALRQKQLDQEACIDLVGEVANTISGNARGYFGKNFHISVPMVLTGTAAALSMPKKQESFIIPFIWRKHRAYLAVGLISE